MLFLVSLALTTAFTALCHGALRKKPRLFYLVFAAIAVLITFYPFSSLNLWTRTNVLGLFQKGYLATALFVIVMYTGALKNEGKLIKALMPIRGQLSILAGILILAHYIIYIKSYMFALSTGGMTPLQIVGVVLAVCMLIVFFPLFITSFRAVRRKMKPAAWKRLQRWAYAFYGLVYIHIMVISVPQALTNQSVQTTLPVLLYTAVFFLYAVLRIRKAQKKSGFAVPVAAAACAVLVCASALYLNAALTSSADDAVSQTGAAGQTLQTSGDTEESEQTDTDVSETTEGETDDSAADETTSSLYQNGTYEGQAMGRNGTITVSVTIQNDAITSIEIVSSREDAAYLNAATDTVIPEILESQDTSVDAATGATLSSDGIMDAVQAALDAAAIS